jgi:hypothetical protein
MSMHLEGPWLSTTGKKRGKKKFASSEAKRKAESLADDWNNLLKRHNITPSAKVSNKNSTANLDTYTTKNKPYRRDADQPHIPSKITSWDPCVKAPQQVYTGTKVKGIGTMHKSNAVPIFSDEQAIEISTMRR